MFVSSWKWISLTVPLWKENSLSVELLIQLSASNPTTITDLSLDPVVSVVSIVSLQTKNYFLRASYCLLSVNRKQKSIGRPLSSFSSPSSMLIEYFICDCFTMLHQLYRYVKQLTCSYDIARWVPSDSVDWPTVMSVSLEQHWKILTSVLSCGNAWSVEIIVGGDKS